MSPVSFSFSPSLHAVLFCRFKGTQQSVSKAVSRKLRQRSAQVLQTAKRLLQRHPALFLHSVKTQVRRPARAPPSRTVRGRLLCSFLRSRNKESLFKTVPQKQRGRRRKGKINATVFLSRRLKSRVLYHPLRSHQAPETHQIVKAKKIFSLRPQLTPQGLNLKSIRTFLLAAAQRNLPEKRHVRRPKC